MIDAITARGTLGPTMGMRGKVDLPVPCGIPLRAQDDALLPLEQRPQGGADRVALRSVKFVRRPPLLPLEALPDRRRGLEGATLNAPPGQFGDTIRELSYGVWLDHRRLDYVYRLYGVQAPHHHSPRSGGSPGPRACAQRRDLLVGAHSPWASPRCGKVLRKAAPPTHDAALFLGRHQAGG